MYLNHWVVKIKKWDGRSETECNREGEMESGRYWWRTSLTEFEPVLYETGREKKKRRTKAAQLWPSLLLNPMMEVQRCRGGNHEGWRCAASLAEHTLLLIISHYRKILTGWKQEEEEKKGRKAGRRIKMNRRLKNQSNHESLSPAHPLDNPCFSYGIWVHCLLCFVNILIYNIDGANKPLPAILSTQHGAKAVQLISGPPCFFFLYVLKVCVFTHQITVVTLLLYTIV